MVTRNCDTTEYPVRIEIQIENGHRIRLDPPEARHDLDRGSSSAKLVSARNGKGGFEAFQGRCRREQTYLVTTEE